MTVRFEGGRAGLLDVRNARLAVWAETIEWLRKVGRPAYVEIDPDTSVITRFLIPAASGVMRISSEAVRDVDVVLTKRSARHYLARANPTFAQMLSLLQAAKDDGTEVLVTATREDHEIIDVRPAPERPSGPAPPSGGIPPNDPPVTPQRAQDLFDAMAAKSCNCAALEPCIPFRYPTDGCFARAHEMCRLMMAEGELPEKIWIDGGLTAATANDPDCFVGWGWHVAPTLLVTTGAGTEKQVIDPSLCSGPVTPAAWKDLQGDPSATLNHTGWDQFWPSGGTDNDFSQTAQFLVEYRLELKEQCADYGAPPYACPILRNCQFIVDRSTFGEDEVAALLQLSSPAAIEAAFYVLLDGFTPNELSVTSATLTDPPNVAPVIAMAPGVAEMAVKVVHLALEDPSHLLRRQRMTWTCRVEFTATSAFVTESRSLALTASIAGISGSAVIQLIKQPNPYEVDGPVSWLSTDLRVFQMKAGASLFGATMGTADAPTFIKQVISNLNAGTTDGQTFENDISTDQQTSKLELSQTVGGTPVFNFAVAKVRYRAELQDAQNVRVFFRLFPASSTSLAYDHSTTYRRGGASGVTVPLLGIQGNELVTIPCFAEARIDTATTNMNAQSDAANVRTIAHDSTGNERLAYFGCWLDVNQTQAQFPIHPSPADGPFAVDRKTIQELVRNQHQCLVAEIAFDLDPIPSAATPGSSDKLAQRNLAIVESANPGIVASRRIPHTFEIRPTTADLGADEKPDELMIDWGKTPLGSLATIHLPGASSDEILRMEGQMYRTHRLVRIDEHTVQCRTGGITYVPIPRGTGANLVGLLSIDLPATVRAGEVLKIVVRQLTSQRRSSETMTARVESVTAAVWWRRVLGTFQITIPVRRKDAIVDAEERLLSNLRWIEKAIPTADRWSSVFRRYVEQTARRVDALGGDSTKVVPAPSDEWKESARRRCRTLALATVVALGMLVVVLGTLPDPLLSTAGLAIVVVALGVGLTWTVQCRPQACRLLRTLVAGLGSGAVILAALALLGASAPHLVGILGVAAATAAIAAVVAWVKQCRWL